MTSDNNTLDPPANTFTRNVPPFADQPGLPPI